MLLTTKSSFVSGADLQKSNQARARALGDRRQTTYFFLIFFGSLFRRLMLGNVFGVSLVRNADIFASFLLVHLRPRFTHRRLSFVMITLTGRFMNKMIDKINTLASVIACILTDIGISGYRHTAANILLGFYLNKKEHRTSLTMTVK